MTYSNCVDPDQNAPEGAFWSGSALFAFLKCNDLMTQILVEKQ